MSASVLITGATGHLGQVLTRLLVSQGYKVVAGVRCLSGDRRVDVLRELGVEIAEVDILKPESLHTAMAGIDGVFHLAAVYSFTSANDTLRMTAVEGTLNVLRAARAAGVTRVVMTSSTTAVGSHAAGGHALDESHWNHNTLEPYARAKTEAEWSALMFAKQQQMTLATIVPAAIIGPGFWIHTPSTQPLDLALKGDLKVIPPLEFSFVDVRDVAQAHLLAFEQKAEGRFIVSGEYCSMSELMRQVKQAEPKAKTPSISLPKVFLPLLPFLDYLSNILWRTPRFATPAFVREFGGKEPRFSSAKIQQQLGWQPRPFSESVRDTLVWIQQELTQKT